VERNENGRGASAKALASRRKDNFIGILASLEQTENINNGWIGKSSGRKWVEVNIGAEESENNFPSFLARTFYSGSSHTIVFITL